MATNFAAIAFSDAVKVLQEKHGSRKSYERMEKFNIIDGLSENEMGFISNRDSFYLASIGVKNFPYIQHRGGPKGFVKVLDENTIGFIDFSGNKQYISVGNFATNTNVALIMMDYPARARLKIFARAEIVELKDNPELLNKLDLAEYQYRPERMILFHIEAYDWNCPQHITPRFTVDEIQIAFKPQLDFISKLEAENKILKDKLENAGLS
ncbi:pyridoxamine 5'-phosphate oxidase family protein [Flavobacterium praedii]|uniref:pyridoxamine 5'-phosphate oxidase family protein n=1 Tax=Flavobacterium praedii TaxID=3002900 RepID=UPI002481B384|nr:pyridoxamine 5'-phosphate oxidase family protein [Flavobacterium praedii]